MSKKAASQDICTPQFYPEHLVLLTDEQIERIARNSCVAIMPPPEDLLQESLLHGSEVKMNNVALAAWGYRKDLWPNQTVLRYRFMNGDSSQKAKMRALFAKADTFVGLAFKEVTTGNTECRVAFNQSGHWSYVGAQCKRIPQNQQTMNVQLTGRDSDREWYRAGMHEIFHWLGLGHEHQHPRHTIDWIKQRVYQVYGRTQGWSIAQIDYQVLKRPTAIGMDGTPTADKDSLMMYPIDRELVSDPNDAVGWNYKESTLDRVVLRRFYPF